MSSAVARPFAELFGGRSGDGSLASQARAAARASYAMVAIKPGTKQPLCTLTPNQAKTADKKAAQAAREAGKRNWERVRHVCGVAHATIDPNVAHRVFKRLSEQYDDQINVAVAVYESRCLVVDADTLAEMHSFTTLWAEQENQPALANAAPTVRSPGEIGPDGQWKHSEGGHFWFLLDEDADLGNLAGVTSIPIGADPEHKAQLKVSGYVLVPPSVRPEGEYRMASDAHVAPSWLVEYVQLYLTERRVTRAHRADRCLDDNDTLTLEQAAISWSSLLEPRGWTLSWKVDRCGCEIYTAPGEHASPKSATAHDPGCGQFDTADGFLHVWTDNPPMELAASGTKTFSKIQLVAWSEHGGDMGMAMRDLGMVRERIEPTVLTRRDIAPAQPPVAGLVGGAEEPDGSSEHDEEEDDDQPEHTSWWFRDLGPVLAGENPEPKPDILGREDGQCLFYPGKVNGIIGPSESGKSWVVLEAAAQELRAGRAVLYFDFEDTASGIVDRLRSLGVPDHLMDPGTALLAYVGPEEALHAVAYAEYAEVLRDRPWSLIVFDGVNAAMTQDGLDLISNTDATRFFTKVTRPASLTGAAVVTIDHVPKDVENRGKGGIGAQAKRASITGSAVYVDVKEQFGRGRPGSLTLMVDKDRPGHVRGASNLADLWAIVIVEANDDGSINLNLMVPPEVTKTTGISYARAEEFRLRVIKYLSDIKAEVTLTMIEKSVCGNSVHVREAVSWLVDNEFVSRRHDGRKQLHRYLRPYPDDGPTVLPKIVDDDPFGGAQG